MIQIKNSWTSMTDKQKWVARGAAFVAKVKATKVVWFPPKPVETGKKAASTAEGTTKKATKGATKRSTRSATGAAKKTSNGSKKAANPTHA